MRISNMTLVKVASIGGILTVSMGIAFRNRVIDNVRSTPHYKDAMSTIRNHNGAVYLLGEPIKDLQIDLGATEKNFTNDLDAQYEIPIKGSKLKGTVYFWASRKTVEDTWLVHRIEIGLKNEPNRRLLVKNVEI